MSTQERNDAPPLEAQSLLQALAEAHVRYCVVGSWAARHHGASWTPRGLDVLAAPDDLNVTNLQHVVKGLQGKRIDVRARGETWHTVHGLLDVSWRDADDRHGLGYARLIRTARYAHAGSKEYAVAGLPELIEHYRRTGRMQTTAAQRYETKAEELQALHRPTRT